MKKRILILSVITFLVVHLGFGQIPGTLSYQGILVGAGGAPVSDGNHTVTFSFFTAATGGSAVFSRGPFTVTTYKGMFTFVIGSGTPTGNTALPTLASDPNYIGGSQYYLEVLADGTILSPRAQLSTVPYALHAQNANTMNASGLTGTGTLPTTVLPSTSVTAGSYGSATQVPTFTVDTKGRLTAASNVAIAAGASGWSLTGNSGTVDGTNFIGTIDNIPLNLRVNNQKAGRINVSDASTFFGYNTGAANTTGTGNSALGHVALTSNTTGSANTAMGTFALIDNTIGTGNTAIGYESLNSNVAGSNGTAVGVRAMQYANNQTGAFNNSNVAVGYEALRGSTTASANTGLSNTALGYQALMSNTTGTLNVALGSEALFTNTTGGLNIAVGRGALYNNLTGGSNVAIGSQALFSSSIGSLNVAIGRDVLQSNTMGGNNVAVGGFSLNSNVSGSYATAIGMGAMQYTNDTSTPFTNTNVAVGYEALRGSVTPSANTGGHNTAIGYQSQLNTTTGFGNTSVGRLTLTSNVSGYDNTAIGSVALAVSTGINNTAVGSYAMPANTTGGENTAIGTFALGNNTTGLGNIAVGSSALAANIGGNSNTALGVLANVGSANLTNATAIGANAIVGASNSMVLGGTGANAVKVGIGITIPTTELHLSHGNVGPSSGHGLTLQNNAGAQSWAMWVSNATGNLNLYQDNNFIGGFDDSNGNYTPVSDGRLKKNVSLAEYALPGLLKIRVRRYHFNSQSDSDLKNIGVIAQELKDIYPELVKYNPDGDRYTVDYMSLVPLTIKAIQEQQDLIKSYEQRINELGLAFENNQQVILELHAMIKSLAVKVNELTQAKSSLVSNQAISGN